MAGSRHISAGVLSSSWFQTPAHGAVDDLLAGLLRIHKAQFELNIGVAAGEFKQYGRQPMYSDVVAGGKAQYSAGALAQVADNTLAFCNFVKDACAAGQQGMAGFRYAHAFADAVKQRDTERVFKRLYTFADRRLGQEQGFGRAGE